jgi:hypothetical protein
MQNAPSSGTIKAGTRSNNFRKTGLWQANRTLAGKQELGTLSRIKRDKARERRRNAYGVAR